MAEPVSDAQPMAVNEDQGAAAPALDLVAPPKPQFGALSAHEMNGGKFEFRKVFVPVHRFTPLKEHWMEIYTPVFEQMKIDIRMNLKVPACFLGFLCLGQDHR
jgi:RNA-binding protein PNO1